MKRLFFLAVIAAIAWYGWNHRDTLFRSDTRSEAVIVNASATPMVRVRLTVAGKGEARDAIEPGQRSTIAFDVPHDTHFRLQWEWRGREGAPQWEGGELLAGPTRERCTLQVFDDGSVTCLCEPLVGTPGKP